MFAFNNVKDVKGFCDNGDVTFPIVEDRREINMINDEDSQEYENKEEKTTARAKFINFTSMERRLRPNDKFVIDIGYKTNEIKEKIMKIFAEYIELNNNQSCIELSITPLPSKSMSIRFYSSSCGNEDALQSDLKTVGFTEYTYGLVKLEYNPRGKYHYKIQLNIPSSCEHLLNHDYFKHKSLQVFVQPAPFCRKCLKMNIKTSDCCKGDKIPLTCFSCGKQETAHEFAACNKLNKNKSLTELLPCLLCNLKTHNTNFCVRAISHWENYSFRYNLDSNNKKDFPHLIENKDNSVIVNNGKDNNNLMESKLSYSAIAKPPININVKGIDKNQNHNMDNKSMEDSGNSPAYNRNNNSLLTTGNIHANKQSN